MLSRTLFGRDSDSLRPSDGAAALGRQIDQRVALLSQLADGHSASLPDEASHRVQLCWSDEDELPSVVNHTCRKHVRESQSQDPALPSTLLWVIMHAWKDASPMAACTDEEQV